MIKTLKSELERLSSDYNNGYWTITPDDCYKLINQLVKDWEVIKTILNEAEFQTHGIAEKFAGEELSTNCQLAQGLNNFNIRQSIDKALALLNDDRIIGEE